LTLGRTAVAAATLFAVVATAGCGLGPGQSSSGTATLKVTSGYGSQPIISRSETDPNAAETVLRFLDRSTEITTRYGGGFVQSIDGLAGTTTGGRRLDWFFFVNGIESSLGAAEVPVNGGDRIWWDYRDWTDVLRAPAVVGSWPEPFAQTSAGSAAVPVEVVCFTSKAPCEEAASRLADAGVDADVVDASAAVDGKAIRLLVGPWARVRTDAVAAQIEDGPATSGVFARFEHEGSAWSLVALDETTEPVPTPEPTAGGLVAALRLGNGPATWVVTGAGKAGVEAAIGALDEDHLTNRYAVVVRDDGTAIGLPEVGSG
jgi:Domain of unknown function (DUF4430)